MPTHLPAVLVRLSISILSNGRQDPGITAGVKALHKLQGNAGRWTKFKLPDVALEPIRKAANRARVTHYQTTLPWEEGYGLLPIAARSQYEAKIAEAKHDFDEAVTEFVAEYPNWIKQALLMHGKTFNEADYPDTSEVATRFAFAFVISPVPSASHFDGQLRGMYGDALEAANAQRIEAAVAETWTRLITPIQSMADKLADPKAIFRDTLVQNVKDIIAHLPALNITGNTALLAAAAEITAKLGKLDADLLRTNKVERKEVAAKAAAIAKRFGALGSNRKFAA